MFMNHEAVIQVDGLVKKFGDFTAVDGISFTVDQGEIFGFLGPNGSGKTTTIRVMLGLIKPTSGVVSVLGIPVVSHPDAIRPKIGYMSQRFSLYNDLTVIQNLNFYGKAYGLPDDLLEKRIDMVLDLAGLKGHEKTKTGDLAGGWRQRLALGASILHEPDLVFLDEPTAGVDPVSRRTFWNLLYALADNGVTVFVTTHYMDEAEHCHRLAFIQRGELTAVGKPEDIKTSQMKSQVLEISVDDPIKAAGILKSLQSSGELPVDEITLYGSLLHVITDEPQEMIQVIREQLKRVDIKILQLEIIEPSLEDVFISSMKNIPNKGE